VINYFGKSQSVTIPTIGIHNVYNALSAFAVGYFLDVDPQLSADALAQYVPAGMRQKVVKVGKITSIEDCYNASPDSMRAALRTLHDTNGNKKIAVLGDMLELGDYSKEAHLSVGKMVGENKIDFLLAYGTNAKYYVSAAKENGCDNAFLFDNKEELSNKLLEIANDDDVVIFKGSRGMKLEDVINTVYKRWEK
jgi:UDP-N-acetylmuramoyl-tripeptide--D-alanyl-D-alanine ligase